MNGPWVLIFLDICLYWLLIKKKMVLTTLKYRIFTAGYTGDALVKICNALFIPFYF